MTKMFGGETDEDKIKAAEKKAMIDRVATGKPINPKTAAEFKAAGVEVPASQISAAVIQKPE